MANVCLPRRLVGLAAWCSACTETMIGRVRTLTLTILLYSSSPGLSALSVGPYDYCGLPVPDGTRVGGVCGSGGPAGREMPGHARPYTSV